MSLAHRFKAEFAPENVDRMRDLVGASLAEAGVGDPYAVSILPVADEIFCNVLEHSRASWVEVEVQPAPGSVQIIVRDDGPLFDPTAHSSMAQETLPQDSGERQLGIYMIGKLSDQCRYRRRDGATNELTFEMKLQAN